MLLQEAGDEIEGYVVIAAGMVTAVMAPGTPVGFQFPELNQSELMVPVQVIDAGTFVNVTLISSKKKLGLNDWVEKL
jgi:hypothetical protein